MRRDAEAGQPWVRRFGIAGVFIFVFVPFWMTGPVVGATIGFLIGLKPRVNLPVVLSATNVATVIWALLLNELHALAEPVNRYALFLAAVALALLALVWRLAGAAALMPRRCAWPAMLNIALRRLALAGLLLAAGCALPAGSNSPPMDEAAASIHLVNHGGHTGIAIARADLPEDFPSLADFPPADHFEFGWGDAEYYPAADPTLRQGTRALFWPTPSVLHVAAIEGDVAAVFVSSTIVRLRLPAGGRERLLDFIRAEFQRDAGGRPIAVAPGLYGTSRFYRGNGKFYFPRTCNWWTAEALAAAGVPIEPARAVTARGLLAQAARHGQVVQRR